MKRIYYYLVLIRKEEIADIQDSSVVLGEHYRFIDYIRQYLEIVKDYVKDIIVKSDERVLVKLKDDTIYEYIVYKIKNI